MTDSGLHFFTLSGTLTDASGNEIVVTAGRVRLSKQTSAPPNGLPVPMDPVTESITITAVPDDAGVVMTFDHDVVTPPPPTSTPNG